MHNRVVGVAGNIEHSNLWAHFLNALRQLAAVHAWHYYICHEQPDGLMIRLADGDALFWRAGRLFVFLDVYL